MPITFLDRPGIVAYLTAGDPSLAATRDIALAALDHGADVIELGVPFSDPLADGPVIERATDNDCLMMARAIDTTTFSSYAQIMEVQFTLDLQSKLTHMAEQQGRDSAALITEAVERLVNHDARFSSKAEVDPYWEQEEQLVVSGAMKMPQEEMDWKRFFALNQTATVSDEAAIQAVIDSRGDR